MGEARNVSYRLRVAPDGLVVFQRLIYEGTLAGERVVVTRTIRYERFDGSVVRLPWFETARNESVRG